MFKSDLFRTAAAVACTIVFSATALVAAVGPAAQNSMPPVASAVAAEARLTA